MPFRFRLDGPLRLSRVRHKERRRELGAVVRGITECDGKLDQARSTLAREAQDRLVRAREGITGAELHRIERTLQIERLRLERQRERREALAAEERKAIDALAAENRTLRTLEQIRERRLGEYRRNIERLEQREADEMTLNRYTGARSRKDRAEER